VIMPNFDNKLRQSPWYVGAAPSASDQRLHRTVVCKSVADEAMHPLARVDPLFWTWDAERVLRVFQFLGIR
jgi:hypothetical protein